jgi:hypothetical protein
MGESTSAPNGELMGELTWELMGSFMGVSQFHGTPPAETHPQPDFSYIFKARQIRDKVFFPFNLFEA